MKQKQAIHVISRPVACLKAKASAAFTMVEVALAMGVVAIGLVAILGLLPNALTSARQAADNTVTATIVQDLFSTLRQQSYTSANLWGTNVNLSIANTVTLNFDQAGNQTNTTAYYKVVVSTIPQSPLLMSAVQATVVWPGLSAAPPNTNVYSTTIACYR